MKTRSLSGSLRFTSRRTIDATWRTIFIPASLALVILTPGRLFARIAGPEDGRAGDPPANKTCNDIGCHATFPLNSGDGSLSIAGLPLEYAPGATYTLEILIADPGQRRWGFETTAIDAAGNQAGVLAPEDTTFVQISEGVGLLRDYAKHKEAGTFPGQFDAASWQLEWTAPAAGTGTTSFYLAGNAANNNDLNTGDYIYTFSADIPEADVSGLDPFGSTTRSAIELAVTPHPLRVDAVLHLALAVEVHVGIALVDPLGREIRRLAGGTYAAGAHEIVWDGRDDLGREVPAGVYYAVVTAAGFRQSERIVVVR